MGGLGLLAALAGCCANSVCDCQDGRIDDLELRFRVAADSLAGGTGFRRTDVDTVYVLRYAPRDSARARHDSVALVRLPSQAAAPVLISNKAPFGPAGGRKLNGYDYEVFVRLNRTGPGRRPSVHYRLSAIELRDELTGDGCCSCFRNTNKRLTVINKKPGAAPVAYNLTDPADPRPGPVVLTR